MQKPISIQLPLLSHSPNLGEAISMVVVAVHGEPVQNPVHGEPLQNLAHWRMHGTQVVVDNRQTITGVIPKAFSNHPTILMVICRPFPSAPRSTNLPKMGHRYQSSEKVHLMMIGQPMALPITRRILEAAH